jgi:hypothetical protein
VAGEIPAWASLPQGNLPPASKVALRLMLLALHTLLSSSKRNAAGSARCSPNSNWWGRSVAGEIPAWASLPQGNLPPASKVALPLRLLALHTLLSSSKRNIFCHSYRNFLFYTNFFHARDTLYQLRYQQTSEFFSSSFPYIGRKHTLTT